MTRDALAPETIEPYVRLALDCVRRPYPYHVVHVVNADADVRPPRELNPAFYGCFDWHSAVHGHWTLVRALHLFPSARWSNEVREVLRANLTQQNLQAEADYLRAPGREGFERPYGLAWLLQLVAELREFEDADARRWQRWIEPLEQIAIERFSTWLPKLTHPIRSGEHSQTAFAMGLAIDYARKWDHGREFIDLLVGRAGEFYLRDVDAPLRYEPSGHDFFSPALAEADLMRRAVMSHEYAHDWLERFLPQIPRDGSPGWLRPASSPDRGDGKLSHLDGLSLSRAWMLEGIAHALPPDDARRAALLACAAAHARAGCGAIEAAHYTGAHWIGSFAVYLLTRRGIT
jgi:hypothetical protein